MSRTRRAAVMRLTKLSSNLRMNKRPRGRTNQRAKMNFPIFNLSRRGENKKENITTKTGTPIDNFSFAGGRLYIRSNRDAILKARRTIKSKIRSREFRTKRRNNNIIIHSIKGNKRRGKSASNILLKSLTIRQIEIALKLNTERKPRMKNRSVKVSHSKVQGHKVIMPPELVNPIRSHTKTNLRTFLQPRDRRSTPSVETMWRKTRKILDTRNRPYLKETNRESTDRTDIRTASPTNQKKTTRKKPISHNPITKCNTARTIKAILRTNLESSLTNILSNISRNLATTSNRPTVETILRATPTH
jgi:hypothetical protein